MFELSKPNTYWKFSMLWKTFLSCSFAVVTMAFTEASVHGHFDGWTASSLKFGKIRLVDVTPTDVMLGAVILGVISGLLGPFFINVNTRINGYRAKIWTRKWQKPIDTFIFAFLSASSFYWFPYLFRSCTDRTVLIDTISKEYELAKDKVLDSEEITSVYQGWCHDNSKFDPLVSLFW
jgi:H+/Cl- antiporter ClcA